MRGTADIATYVSPYRKPNLSDYINWNAVYSGVMSNPAPSSNFRGKQNAPLYAVEFATQARTILYIYLCIIFRSYINNGSKNSGQLMNLCLCDLSGRLKYIGLLKETQLYCISLLFYIPALDKYDLL